MLSNLSHKIKEQAFLLGLDACSICKAEVVDELNTTAFESWIDNNYHADMGYMVRNVEKRLDPTLLVEGAKSIIVVALNYYPQVFQDEDRPQIAYYAYGKDYHDVVKERLKALYDYCKSIDKTIGGRYFCDTAPLLERYWATKSGIGWIGKNSMLIIPQRGSYFFLGALIINKEVEYDNIDAKKLPSCGSCTRCIDACPTAAITSPHIIDSQKCISYQTIENKGEIDPSVIPQMSNRFYGCDICQQVCPWNKLSTPHTVDEFTVSEELLDLTSDDIVNLGTVKYQRIFKGSPIKRAKLSGLKRNIEALRKNKNNIL